MIGILNEKETELFLKNQFIGHLGCRDNEKIYILPITYAYDGKYIYGHTRPGHKIEMMRKSPSVCIEVEKIEDMHQWQSVIAWGVYEELKGQDAKDAIQILMNKTYGKEKTHWFDIGLNNAVTYRIRLTEKSGRFQKKP